MAKKGALEWGKPSAAKAASSWRLQMVLVFLSPSTLPLALYATSASPHEVTLVQDTLSQVLVGQQPERLIGDKAYDSDPLDEKLAEQGIDWLSKALR